MIYFTFQKGLEVSRTRNTEKTWTIIFASGVIVYYIWKSACNVLHNWFFIAKIFYSHRLNNEGPFHIRISFSFFQITFSGHWKLGGHSLIFLVPIAIMHCMLLVSMKYLETIIITQSNDMKFFFIRFFITRMNSLRHLNPI